MVIGFSCIMEVTGVKDALLDFHGIVLFVLFSQGERGRHRDGSRANQRPTKTLFVINFDPIRTRVRDIEKHFEPYGKLHHVRIRRNFAFVQFETQEDATKALECTHMRLVMGFCLFLVSHLLALLQITNDIQFLVASHCSKILDRVVSVEYALRDDDEKGDRYDSPRRGGYGRSPSPVYRRRPSPDYGRPRSPVYDRYNGPAYDRRRSPDYGRPRSPGYGRPRSPEYGRARRYCVWWLLLLIVYLFSFLFLSQLIRSALYFQSLTNSKVKNLKAIRGVVGV